MKKNKLRIWQAVFLLIFIISAGILVYQMVCLPLENRKMAEQLKEDFPEETPGDFSPEENPLPAGREEGVSGVNLAALKAKYPDVRGWLTVPGTGIDYPVLQSREYEPEYYLRRNYRGEEDVNGSLFLQWNCEVSESKNLIIYGHNMNSGAMFGNLGRYADQEYCRSHLSVFFQTLEGMAEYEVTAVIKADVQMFPFQQVKFQEPDGLEKYIRQAKAQSLFGIEAGADKKGVAQVLTLVTCSYEWQGARNIVVAVRK